MLKKFKTLAEDWAVNQNKRFTRDKNFRVLTMCKQCYTFYYRNSWHFERPQLLDTENEPTVAVRFTQCPACVEQETAFYDLESESFA
jgi:heterodisulfide reductase subunit B